VNAHRFPARLRIKDNRIETSRGAQVLVESAKKLWPFIERARKNGGLNIDWKRGGIVKIDFYTVTDISPKGDLTIGCHYIPYNEIRRIADQLDLVKEAA